MNYPVLLVFILYFSTFTPYTATSQTVGETEFGRASYYSDAYAGSETSFGEKYDPTKLTAAHRRFPYNSRVRVTHIGNNRSVVVRIIDEGPLIRGRIIELSRRAAEQLQMTQASTADVKIELLEIPGQRPLNESESIVSPQPRSASNSGSTQRPTSYDNALPPERDRLREVVVTARTTEDRTTTPRSPRNTLTGTGGNRTTTANTRSSNRPSWDRDPDTYPQVGKKFEEYGVYKIEIREPTGGNYGVQVASLSSYESALQAIADYQERYFDNILVSIDPGPTGKKFRIILGPFESESSAQRYKADLKKRYRVDGFTVRLTP